MNFSWKNLSINDLEKNYNPREAVFNFSDYIEKYKTLGKEFRKKLPCILDVSYGDTPLQKLDIFGKKTLKNASVHIFIHGGYWRALDKSDHSQLANPFVENNILYFSINHDLCPAVTLSEIIQQVNSAIIWIYNNCKNYGGDKNKITISGHSAGAYLAAILALNKDLKIHKMRKIKGAILISPFLYVEETAPERIKRGTIYKSIWGTNPKDWEKASVSPHMDGNNENFISIMAENDAVWRKEQNKRFINKLKEKQTADYIEITNRDHSSLISKILEKDDQVSKTIIEFIRS